MPDATQGWQWRWIPQNRSFKPTTPPHRLFIERFDMLSPHRWPRYFLPLPKARSSNPDRAGLNVNLEGQFRISPFSMPAVGIIWVSWPIQTELGGQKRFLSSFGIRRKTWLKSRWQGEITSHHSVPSFYLPSSLSQFSCPKGLGVSERASGVNSCQKALCRTFKHAIFLNRSLLKISQM